MLWLIFAATAIAGPGMSFSSGSRIIPVNNDQVQLVRENVKIRLSVDSNSEGFGFPFIPWANVTAVYHLKNTQNNDVKLLAGLPFNGPMGHEYRKFVIDNLGLTVSSEGKSFETTLRTDIANDKNQYMRFTGAFVWEDTFAPNQEKSVTVSYKSPIYVGIAPLALRMFKENSDMSKLFKYGEIDSLFPSIMYSYSYNMRASQAWNGQLEEASFSLDADELLTRLGDKSFVEYFDLTGYKLTRPLVLERHYQENYVRNGSTYTWTLSGKQPGDEFYFSFFGAFIPATTGDVDNYIKYCSTKLKNTSKNDFLAITTQYYKAFAYDGEIDSISMKEYFDNSWLVEKRNKLVFKKDRENIKEVIDEINDLASAK